MGLTEHPHYSIKVENLPHQPLRFWWDKAAPGLSIPAVGNTERLLAALARHFASERNPLYRPNVSLAKATNSFPLRLEADRAEIGKTSPTVFDRVVQAVLERRLLGVTVLFETPPMRRGRFLRPLGLIARPSGFSLVALDEEALAIRVDLARLEAARLFPSFLPIAGGIDTDFERACERAVEL